MKENLIPFLDVTGNILRRDEEKTEVLHDLFASVFSRKTNCSPDTQVSELIDRDMERTARGTLFPTSSLSLSPSSPASPSG